MAPPARRPVGKGDAFDAPFQQAWGAPFPMADQETEPPEYPDTPTAESEDWRAQGDGMIIRSTKTDPFLDFAEKWVDERGLLDPDSDYGGLLGGAVLAMAKTFAGAGHSGMSALLARAYFNFLCDGFEDHAHRTMILSREDYARAVAALDPPVAKSTVAKRLAQVRARLAKAAATKLEFQGLPLEIDRPKGFVQEGQGPDGMPWRRVYLYDYGFIPDTEGGDGEGVDVFIGPETEHPTAYWVAQKTFDGGFDEWKVFVGFPSADRARLAFVFHTPRELLGPVYEMPVAAMCSLLGIDGARDAGPHLLADMKKAQWSGAYVNALPDSAFLYVEGGGEKDDEGKTKPRSLRHFPYKDKAGNVDLVHVRAALSRIPQADISEGKKEELSARASRLLEQAEKAMTTKATTTRTTTDCRKNKIAKAGAIEVSFDDIRRMVQEALSSVLPPDPTDGPCASSNVWISDIYDDFAIFDREGLTWKIGYSFGNGVVTLTGAPVQVVRQYAEISGTPGDGATTEETTMGKNAVKKDQEGSPGAAADAGGMGDGMAPVNDGADIVLLAFDRLEDAVDAIEAGGGVLTPDIRQTIDGVCALLETVAPDEDDYNEDGLAGGEGVPAPMSANEKAAKEETAKRFVAAKAFVRKVAKAIAKTKAETNPTKKAAMASVLEKALTYGGEVFGSETQFASANLGSTIPEFDDPAQTRPQEVATPAEQKPTGQWQQDAPGYTPNENSQQAYDAGSPQIAEKLAKLRKRIQVLKGEATVAAGDTAPPESVTKSTLHAQWTPAYLAQLPDSAFLQVETGVLKDYAGRSNLMQGPGSGFRHFAVRDVQGSLSVTQLQKALRDIPMAGLEEDVKKSLTAQATQLLKEAEGEAASELAKAARGDDGWPSDMNDPRFRAGKKPAAPSFGHDDLKGKVERGVAAGAKRK